MSNHFTLSLCSRYDPSLSYSLSHDLFILPLLLLMQSLSILFSCGGLQYQQQHLLVSDIYYIPHWINYSYYNPPQRWMKYQFHPRIKMSDSLVCTNITVDETVCGVCVLWGCPVCDCVSCLLID